MTQTAIRLLTSWQLGDIAVGLCYRTCQLDYRAWDSFLSCPLVHSQDVIHGDLHSVGLVTRMTIGKGLLTILPQDNVLIDDQGTACLTDFGLSFISDFVGSSYLKSNICGVVSFADPTLVERAYISQDNVCYPTKSCDIYSFGGLMLHVRKSVLLHDLVSDMPLIGLVWEETI